MPLNETVQVYSKPFTITQDVTLALTPDMGARAAKGDPQSARGSIGRRTEETGRVADRAQL